LLALVAAAAFTGPALPQSSQADPVESLRQLLRANPTDLTARQRGLNERVGALQELGDVCRALSLLEWRDEDLDPAVAAVDLAARATLVERFEPMVRAELRLADARRQLAAAKLLADVGMSAPKLLAKTGAQERLGRDLTELISQGRSPLCEAAAEALGQTGGEGAVVAAALGRLLNDMAPARRQTGARALVRFMRGAMGAGTAGRGTALAVRAASTIVPVAGRALKDKDARVRRLGIGAIAQAAALVARLTLDPAGRVDNGALDFLPLAVALKDEGPALKRALDDPDDLVRTAAGKALEDMAAAHQRLVQRSATARPGSRGDTGPIRTVSSTGADSDPVADDLLLEGIRPALPALVAAVYSPDARARRRAIDVLEALGPAAAPATHVLVRALTDRDRFVRWAAARTLGKLPPSAESVAGLENLLADVDPDVCRSAAAALQGFGPAAAPAAAGLARALVARDPALRLAAIRALKALGPKAASASAALREAAADSDAPVREAAVELLRKLDNQAGRGTP
jgi:HEAT repeat protein